MVSDRVETGSQVLLVLAYPPSLSRYCLLFCWFCVVITTRLPLTGILKMHNWIRILLSVVNRKKHTSRVALSPGLHKQVFRYRCIHDCVVCNRLIFNKSLQTSCDLTGIAYFSSQTRIIMLKICLHECSISC